MSAIDKIKRHLPQIQSLPEKITVSDKCKIDIKCNNCDTINNVSVRNLIRKWSNEEYKCKSCHVKTYANKPERIKKFQKSFSKTASTKEHKDKCSKSAKKLWDTPELRAKVSKAVSEDNKVNPLKIEARKKAHKAWMEKYGKRKLLEMRSDQRTKTSILESIFKSLLEEYNINYEAQYNLGYYKFDFFLVDYNILVELNGEYWHKETNAFDSAKATYANKLNYIVKTIWENEFSEIGKVKSLLLSWVGCITVEQVDFKFDDIILKEINNKEARVFLGKYHYLPAISKSGYHLGCYLEDRLIASITFSHVTRKEMIIKQGLKSTREIREVGRFCISTGYNKRNFASWFMSKAVKEFKKLNNDVRLLISFADTTLHGGTIYKASNWIYDGETKPNYMYQSPDGYLIHKKTVWDRAKKLNNSEEEYSKNHSYLKVWSKKKYRFIYKIGKITKGNRR